MDVPEGAVGRAGEKAAGEEARRYGSGGGLKEVAAGWVQDEHGDSLGLRPK